MASFVVEKKEILCYDKPVKGEKKHGYSKTGTKTVKT